MSLGSHTFSLVTLKLVEIPDFKNIINLELCPLKAKLIGRTTEIVRELFKGLVFTLLLRKII